MAQEEYEILPHSLLEDLKYDVEALKKKLQEPETKTNELILEIESLKDSIHELNDVFKKALEISHDEDIFKSIKNLNEKIAAVVTQNETIARGMIAISDKVDNFIANQKLNSGAPNYSRTQTPQVNVKVNAPTPSLSGNLAPSVKVTQGSSSFESNNFGQNSFPSSPQMMQARNTMVPAPPSFGQSSGVGAAGIPHPPEEDMDMPKPKRKHGFF